MLEHSEDLRRHSTPSSDLTPVDPQEVVAGAIGRAGGVAPAAAAANATDQEHESTQRLWWYLLFAGVLVLAGETVLSNRLGKQPV